MGEPSLPTNSGSGLYDRLTEKFSHLYHRQVAGVELSYITGEQCVTRLNEVLGFDAWQFTVKEHGIHVEADEVWVLGELTIWATHTIVTRQQFGSQKIKRSRASGTIIDLGFDLKGATTDSLKKCSSLVGVGLYLSAKEETAPVPTNGSADQGFNGTYTCDSCGATLEEVRFKDGATWLPAQLAAIGKRKYGRVLCMAEYRQANEAQRQAATADTTLGG